MKLSLPILALLAATTLIAAARPTGRVPKFVEEKWREKGGLKDTFVPSYQTIPRGASFFVINGLTVRMDDLARMDDIFSDDAMVIVGGVKQKPEVFVYKSRTYPEVRAIVDDDKNLIMASIDRGNSQSLDLLHVYDEEFAEVDSSTDIDYSQFEGYLTVSIGTCS
jgi:hypothetical protein